jgi:hypothetical protein
MNRYLGIEQITTGSHNPRSNAVVMERFMQHLNGCLTKCEDSQYKNMKDFLPAIAFAHSTAFNSAINCTPFEAGHGLRAKTITEARANTRLQQGDRVYFYRPPSQHEVIRRGRKAKHLAHYHGPTAIQQGKVDGRDRQYHLTYL